MTEQAPSNSSSINKIGATIVDFSHRLFSQKDSLSPESKSLMFSQLKELDEKKSEHIGNRNSVTIS